MKKSVSSNPWKRQHSLLKSSSSFLSWNFFDKWPNKNVFNVLNISDKNRSLLISYTGLTTTKCAFWVYCYGGIFYHYKIILMCFSIYFEVIFWIYNDFWWRDFRGGQIFFTVFRLQYHLIIIFFLSLYCSIWTCLPLCTLMPHN